jgi:hypothetical protein
MMWPVTSVNVKLETYVGLIAHLHGDDVEFC